MTHTTATLDALTRACLDAPADDTVRLVFADALDEAGEAARAELIRVQVELARTPPRPTPTTGLMPANHAAAVLKWQEEYHERSGWLHRRERELLTIAKTWERVPCPECRERGHSHAHCEVCRGTEDLLFTRPHPHHVDWQRGFGVVSCESRDVWRKERSACPHCVAGWDRHRTNVSCSVCHRTGSVTRTVPTPWAREIAKWAVGLRLVDRTPLEWTEDTGSASHDGDRWFSWMRPCNVPDQPHRVPDGVIDVMVKAGAKQNRQKTSVRFDTREAAVDALGWAVAQWARA